MNPELDSLEKQANCALGLMDECAELHELIFPSLFNHSLVPNVHAINKTNIVSELGDLTWYSAVLVDNLGAAGGLDAILAGIDPDWVLPTSPNDPAAIKIVEAAFHRILNAAGNVAGAIKKRVFHQHPTCSKVENILNANLRIIFEQTAMIGFLVAGVSLTEILEKNIEKLRARYGEKFSAEASACRSA